MHNLLSAIRGHALAQPDKPALAGSDDVILYGELPSAVSRHARQLTWSACRVAAILMDNGLDWILWDLACIEAGVVCVPLPSFFTHQQREHAIRTAGIDTLITREGLLKTGYDAAPRLPEGTAKVTFTSGTTGHPKGVCLSVAGMEAVAGGLLERIGARHAGCHMSVLPLSVLLENVAGVYTALLAGATCFIPTPATIGLANPFAPDFGALAGALKAATSTILVPELLRGLFARLMSANDALPLLTFVAVGGAKTDPALIVAARRHGIPVYEGYGLTECGSVVALNTACADKPGTVGQLLPHVRARIGFGGEIVVENPLFLGYTDGSRPAPFFTGDLGEIDADGFVSISGRRRNVIITSFGRNVSPEWIESLLQAQSEIAQAVVYGEALPRPRVLVVPSGRGNIGNAVARANERLPEYARIAAIHAVQPFTVANGLLTGNGRPRRAEIMRRHALHIQREEPHVLLQSAG